MKDNAIGIIVVGLIAFLAIIVTGKWLLDKKETDRVQQQVAPIQLAPVQPRQPDVIVIPPMTPAYPYYYPQYNRNNNFWLGYADGWNGLPPQRRGPDYIQGYQVGGYDRRRGNHYYYDTYCPPGFSLRLPGFRLDIR